ncbi:FtsX-like permease family protein [Nocardiopsis sp. NPDC058631]|uniref:ABC transporter permease n=1 Tax=Nocardiopsis sp. NPDC058631 TaxID=3346566 RepID=UPI0036525B3E
MKRGRPRGGGRGPATVLAGAGGRAWVRVATAAVLILRTAVPRARPLVLSALSLALGAGLVVAALSLQEAAERTSGGASWLLTRAPVVVVAEDTGSALPATPSGEPARLPPDAVAALSGVPGVHRVGTEAPFPAHVVTGERTLGGRTDRSWGHSWTLAEAESLALVEGRAPRAPGEAALDARTAREAGVRAGGRTRVLTSEGISPVLVTGVVAVSDGPPRDRAVFLAPAEAAGHGGDPVLALVRTEEDADPEHVAEAIRAQVPGVRALTGHDRAGALAPDHTDRELSSGMGRYLGVVAGVALAVAGVMAASLFSLAVHTRAREFALLRLVGAGPGLVRRLVVGEALLVGGVAAALSWLFGTVLVFALARLFAERGMLPHGFAPTVDWSALATGAALAFAVPLAACLRPALAAGRIAPAEALRSAEAGADTSLRPRTRPVLGGVALGGAGGLFLAAWSGSGTEAGAAAALSASAVLVLALALLSPLLVYGTLLLLRPLTREHALASVASSDAWTDPRGAAGVLTPLLVTTAVACLLLFQGPTTTEARLHAYGERLAADLVVSGPPGVGLPRTAREAAARVPGVAAVGGFRQTVTSAPGGPGMTTHLVDPEAVGRVHRLAVQEGDWSVLGADGVALRADLARDNGWAAGDTAALVGPDGTGFDARVAVVYRAGLDFPGVLLPRETLAPRMLDAMDSGLYVVLDHGADPGATASLLEEAVDAGPETSVVDRASHLDQQAELSEGDDWILWLTLVPVAALAGISAVVSLVVSVSARSRRFALLRLVGATRNQVVGMVVAQTLAAVAVAVTVGSAAALAGLASLGRALTGGSAVLAVPPGQYAVIVGCVLALGLLASAVPAAAALRARPVHAAEGQL